MTAPPTWRTPLLEGLPCIPILLGPLARWFGYANRHSIFLYRHLGAEPFDTVTRGRCWMSTLVASGMVLVHWVLRCWLGGVWSRRQRTPWAPPEWWRIWVVSALPTALGCWRSPLPWARLYCSPPWHCSVRR